MDVELSGSACYQGDSERIQADAFVLGNPLHLTVEARGESDVKQLDLALGSYVNELDFVFGGHKPTIPPVVTSVKRSPKSESPGAEPAPLGLPARVLESGSRPGVRRAHW
jgi:hypothetical protein